MKHPLGQHGSETGKRADKFQAAIEQPKGNCDVAQHEQPDDAAE